MNAMKFFPCFLAIVLLNSAVFAGQVKLSTYYPAPSGDYRELKSTENANFATTSGNVGVGTTTPSGKLHVKTSNAFTPVFLTAGTGVGATAGTWRVQAENGIANQGAAFTIYSDTASRHRLFINGGGTVGINTSSPQTTQVNPNSGLNRSIHLDVAESIVADDVYLRSPTFGSARWASQMPTLHIESTHVTSPASGRLITVDARCPEGYTAISCMGTLSDCEESNCGYHGSYIKSSDASHPNDTCRAIFDATGVTDSDDVARSRALGIPIGATSRAVCMKS